MERREERRSGVPARLHARPLAHSEHIPNFGLVIRPAFGFRRPKTTMEREDRRSGVPARLHARPQRRSGVPARLHARPHRRSGVPARLHARPHAHAEHIPKFGLAVRPACGYRRPLGSFGFDLDLCLLQMGLEDLQNSPNEMASTVALTFGIAEYLPHFRANLGLLSSRGYQNFLTTGVFDPSFVIFNPLPRLPAKLVIPLYDGTHFGVAIIEVSDTGVVKAFLIDTLYNINGRPLLSSTSPIIRQYLNSVCNSVFNRDCLFIEEIGQKFDRQYDGVSCGFHTVHNTLLYLMCSENDGEVRPLGLASRQLRELLLGQLSRQFQLYGATQAERLTRQSKIAIIPPQDLERKGPSPSNMRLLLIVALAVAGLATAQQFEEVPKIDETVSQEQELPPSPELTQAQFEPDGSPVAPLDTPVSSDSPAGHNPSEKPADAPEHQPEESDSHVRQEPVGELPVDMIRQHDDEENEKKSSNEDPFLRTIEASTTLAIPVVDESQVSEKQESEKVPDAKEEVKEEQKSEPKVEQPEFKADEPVKEDESSSPASPTDAPSSAANVETPEEHKADVAEEKPKEESEEPKAEVKVEEPKHEEKAEAEEPTPLEPEAPKEESAPSVSPKNPETTTAFVVPVVSEEKVEEQTEKPAQTSSDHALSEQTPDKAAEEQSEKSEAKPEETPATPEATPKPESSSPQGIPGSVEPIVFPSHDSATPSDNANTDAQTPKAEETAEGKAKIPETSTEATVATTTDEESLIAGDKTVFMPVEQEPTPEPIPEERKNPAAAELEKEEREDEAKPEPSPEPKAQPEPSPEPEAKAEPTPEPEAKPEPSPEPEAKPEPSPEPAAEPTPEPAPEPTAEPKPEPSAEEPKAEPSPAPESQPKAEPSPEPAAEPTPEPKPEPSPEEPKAEPSPEPEPKAEPSPEPEPKAEPSPEPKAEPSPEPSPEEPKAEPTPEPEPGPKAEPSPEPKAEPSPEPEPVAEPTPEPEPEPTHDHNHHHDHPSSNGVKTPFSLRFTNIDFSPEFEDKTSGVFKKLKDQINEDLTNTFSDTFGDNFLSYDITNIRKGSVIIEGKLVTRDEIGDPALVAARLEDVIVQRQAKIGGNDVDVTAVSIDGVMSKGSASMKESAASGQAGYVVAASVIIGILILIFIIFAVIIFGVNKSRRKQTLKLKEELNMAEGGRSPYKTNGNGLTSGNPNSPMLLSSSQFSSPPTVQTPQRT
ncbi:unnamed protein product [Bursaphelenchus xylophilus]|nr:unnamed protein product [Bursaphelenchus xylophilus]CAG9082215.1 unnamed protein product [Bursaphelenchus xylophilus]